MLQKPSALRVIFRTRNLLIVFSFLRTFLAGLVPYPGSRVLLIRILRTGVYSVSEVCFCRKKAIEPLDTMFNCPFCNHEKSCEVCLYTILIRYLHSYMTGDKRRLCQIEEWVPARYINQLHMMGLLTHIKDRYKISGFSFPCRWNWPLKLNLFYLWQSQFTTKNLIKFLNSTV